MHLAVVSAGCAERQVCLLLDKQNIELIAR